MFSFYNGNDDGNFATAIFSSREFAEKAKEITEKRADIKYVMIQENCLQTEPWKQETWRK